MKEFVGLRAKTYSYLKKNNDENKKAKGTKKCVIKRELIFQDYKNCLRASQIKNIINSLEKKEIDLDCLKEDEKELIKNRRILKTKQRFKAERHNVFTEEINKIALSSNDDKRIQSINSIETYACGKTKDLICKKEKIKQLSIIKTISECLTLIMSQMKTKQNIIQNWRLWIGKNKHIAKSNK